MMLLEIKLWKKLKLEVLHMNNRKLEEREFSEGKTENGVKESQS